jgi:hypothetical protein
LKQWALEGFYIFYRKQITSYAVYNVTAECSVADPDQDPFGSGPFWSDPSLHDWQKSKRFGIKKWVCEVFKNKKNWYMLSDSMDSINW